MSDHQTHDEAAILAIYHHRCKPDPRPPERDGPKPVTAGDSMAGRMNLLGPSFRRIVPANEIEFECRGYVP